MCRFLTVRAICPTCLRIRPDRSDIPDPLIVDPCPVHLCDRAVEEQRMCRDDEEHGGESRHINVVGSIQCQFCISHDATTQLRQVVSNDAVDRAGILNDLYDTKFPHGYLWGHRPYHIQGPQGALLRVVAERIFAKKEKVETGQHLPLVREFIARLAKPAVTRDPGTGNRVDMSLIDIYNKPMGRSDLPGRTPAVIRHYNVLPTQRPITSAPGPVMAVPDIVAIAQPASPAIQHTRVQRSPREPSLSPFSQSKVQIQAWADMLQLDATCVNLSHRVLSSVWVRSEMSDFSNDLNLISVAAMIAACWRLNLNQRIEDWEYIAGRSFRDIRHVLTKLYQVLPSYEIETLLPEEVLQDSGESRPGRVLPDPLEVGGPIGLVDTSSPGETHRPESRPAEAFHLESSPEYIREAAPPNPFNARSPARPGNSAIGPSPYQSSPTYLPISTDFTRGRRTSPFDSDSPRSPTYSEGRRTPDPDARPKGYGMHRAWLRDNLDRAAVHLPRPRRHGPDYDPDEPSPAPLPKRFLGYSPRTIQRHLEEQAEQILEPINISPDTYDPARIHAPNYSNVSSNSTIPFIPRKDSIVLAQQRALFRDPFTSEDAWTLKRTHALLRILHARDRGGDGDPAAEEDAEVKIRDLIFKRDKRFTKMDYRRLKVYRDTYKAICRQDGRAPLQEIEDTDGYGIDEAREEYGRRIQELEIRGQIVGTIDEQGILKRRFGSLPESESESDGNGGEEPEPSRKRARSEDGGNGEEGPSMKRARTDDRGPAGEEGLAEASHVNLLDDLFDHLVPIPAPAVEPAHSEDGPELDDYEEDGAWQESNDDVTFQTEHHGDVEVISLEDDIVPAGQRSRPVQRRGNIPSSPPPVSSMAKVSTEQVHDADEVELAPGPRGADLGAAPSTQRRRKRTSPKSPSTLRRSTRRKVPMKR